MKRLIVAIILIFTVAGLCTFEFILNTSNADYTSQELSKAQNLIKNNNKKDAIKTMSELKQNWKNNVESMLIFISHQKPDEIGENLAVAESYLINNELPEFFAECKRVEDELEHFKDLEIPTLSNIL